MWLSMARWTLFRDGLPEMEICLKGWFLMYDANRYPFDVIFGIGFETEMFLCWIPIFARWWFCYFGGKCHFFVIYEKSKNKYPIHTSMGFMAFVNYCNLSKFIHFYEIFFLPFTRITSICIVIISIQLDYGVYFIVIAVFLQS